MRLLRLNVEHFGCIRAAALSFGPGLNVLFGPNDLGKSTLAQALRAALLLPHTSAAAATFAPWQGDETPTVELQFQTGEQRIWRLRKSFGKGARGSSLLETSRDGRSFAQEAKARAVDAKVRELLAWGLPRLGGKSKRTRGLPQTFLSTVLLGEQAEVTQVFAETLADDFDESGRKRLNAALEAFAQDEDFKRILAEADQRVQAVFDSKGNQRRARSSPLVKASEAVKRAKHELAQLDEEVGRSIERQRGISELKRQRDALESRLAVVRSQHAVLERDAARLAERSQVSTQLEQARATLQSHRSLVAETGELEVRLRSAEAALPQATEAVEAAARARTGAEEAVRQAEQSIAELAGGAAAQRRELQKQQLENRRQALDHQERALQQKRTRASEAQQQHQVLANDERRLAQLEAALAQERAEEEQAAARAREAEHEQELLEAARKLQEIGRLSESITRAEKAREQALSLRAEAVGLEARAQAGRSDPERPLPSADKLAQLEKLEHNRQLAEARLGGGLSLWVQLQRSLALTAKADGKPLALLPGELELNLDAQRSLELQLEGVAELKINVGQAEVRAELKRLEQRCQRELRPVLQQAGLPDLSALRAALASWQQRLRESEALASKAASLRAQASLQDQAAAKLVEERQRWAALEAELEQLDRAAAEQALADWGQLTPGAFEKRRRRAEAAERKARHLVTQARGSQTRLAGEQASLRGGLDVRREQLQRGEQPEDGWAAELARLEQAQAELARQRADWQEERGRAEQDERAQQSEALQARQAAVEALARVEAQQAAVLEALSEQKGAVHRLQGELKVKRELIAQLDLEQDEARVAALEARLAQLPEPEQAVSAELLAAAAANLARAEQQLAGLQRQLDEARGALKTVGGQVVHEQREQAREALELAEQHELELTVEYEAWRLLRETLREAETCESRHLGELLSGPVSEQFAALTAGRYGKLELDAHLHSEGLRAAGGLRALESLSLGTQEQLATLLRVTIAEFLDSCLVLDDQLTQTDPERSRWFNELLRARVDRIQTIVLTCRPLDYLEAAELPGEGQSSRDRAGGAIRALDLRSVIERC